MKINDEVFREMGEVFYQVLNSVKNIVAEVIKNILNRKKKKKYDYNWQVPKNIVMNHQVMDKKPLVANIRSNL